MLIVHITDEDGTLYSTINLKLNGVAPVELSHQVEDLICIHFEPEED